LVVNMGKPAQLPGHGRLGVLAVQPRGPIADDPATFNRRGRVAGRNYPASLRLARAWVNPRRPVPGVDKAELRLKKLRNLVPAVEVMRPALVSAFVLFVLARANFHHAAVHEPPDVQGLVIAVLEMGKPIPVVNLPGALDQGPGLGKRSA